MSSDDDYADPPDSDPDYISPLFGYRATKGNNWDLSEFADRTEREEGGNMNNLDESPDNPPQLPPRSQDTYTDPDAPSGSSSRRTLLPSPYRLAITYDEAKMIYLSEKGLAVGRPSKLTPERHKFIVEKIREGVPVRIACNLSGVNQNATFDWIAQGRQDIKDGKETIYSNFACDVIIAQNELEARLASKWAKIVTEPNIKRVYREQIIDKPDGTFERVKYLDKEEISGDGVWQGIAEYMSRRFPERWKRQQTIEQTGPDGGPIQVVQATIDVERMTPEARELLLREIKTIQGEREKEREGEGKRGIEIEREREEE